MHFEAHYLDLPLLASAQNVVDGGPLGTVEAVCDSEIGKHLCLSLLEPDL